MLTLNVGSSNFAIDLLTLAGLVLSLERECSTTPLVQGNSWPASLFAGWSSLVARMAHNHEVAGSNPAPATNLRVGPYDRLVDGGGSIRALRPGGCFRLRQDGQFQSVLLTFLRG